MNWIKNLKVGDKVFVQYGGRDAVPMIETVERVHKNYVTVGEYKYSAKTGNRTSANEFSHFYNWKILPIDDPHCLNLVERELCEDAISDLRVAIQNASAEDCNRIRVTVARLIKSIKKPECEE